MKKRKQIQRLQFKRNTIVNLFNRKNIKGGFKDFTGDSCFEVCNTDLRNCTW
ncbi:hypothetical protein [uncultured Kordia sp.]|uniref:hypothetical protein n=1 Tax=uncultured Kordia sp. TaxID=507699 RepID=UPI00262EB2A6|nr:hypothetical protein [uncultured Kordia sp.]